ncbi:probable polygalacturonase At1g80170 [Phalaenopsis equestris]|uniref:probable polygalacturonase At1g80170 n=1 Tax=Phalaenopsis equestris TaxID=78828 RepID=UPI0009E5288B|nr:probable polygalacturonase At1g80170 [Phalaenopsis equestris]
MVSRCFSSSSSASSSSRVTVVVVLGLLLSWSERAGAGGFEPMLRLPSFRRGARRSRTMRVVSVINHGAKGNGIQDDTKAFLDAWKLACSSKVGAILKIPAGNVYFLRQTNFGGPCKSKVTMLLMGTIVAPSDPDIWQQENARRWLYFHGIKDLEIRGEGVIDGMGQEWWARSCKVNSSNPCRRAPTAITFHRMRRLSLQDLTLVNSQKIHLAFSNCFQVQVSRVKVIAPERSPNTDGIHISSSVSVSVKDSIIGTGDDCISIVGNSSSILIKNIVCGPGHGISIGSLGKNKSNDQLQNVLVDEAYISNTENGVRIKTWQGGEGFAQSIAFRNILMRNVSNPIIIDQFYCDSAQPCHNQTSAVKVGQISFINIKGTSATEDAVKFACSDSFPCEKIFLKDIELSLYSGGETAASCWKASGYSSGAVHPPSCLSSEDLLIKQSVLSLSPLYSSIYLYLWVACN